MQKPESASKNKTMRSQNLDKSSQAMPIPRAAEEDREGAFPSKWGTFENSGGGNSLTEFVKNYGFPRQEPLFEGSTFPNVVISTAKTK